MLHTEAVDRKTLDLIVDLQAKEYLKGFHLVGGTALALSLSHRYSLDIDLFSSFSFETGQLLENLTCDFKFNLFYSAINTLKGSIGTIKVDILAHRYPLIREPYLFNGITLLSEHDIIAMKLNAITTSGQRVKDFIDIFFLLQKFDLKEMLAFYKQKYSLQNDTIALKSLLWFDDVDLSEWPVFINDPSPDWKMIKKTLTRAVRDYMRSDQ
ncbi:MAG: hypothetical protein D4R64_14755 [Porphyromonadaceae bacterium]|nr:MAG: hypothetical protein D4R64_14755 [Porphyromonadaceae bacterium]